MQNIFRVKGIDQDVETFMINLVKETIGYREKHNYSRKDLLQLMIQLRNTGNVHNDDVWDTAIADGIKSNFFLSYKNHKSIYSWIYFLQTTIKI